MRLELRTDIAHPRDLERSLLPLFVQIHNESPRDLLVRPQAFHLISRSGERHQAIPAERLRRPKESPVTSDIAVALAGLPDDVLANGAKTEGFLYFERFEAEPPIGLTFELRAQLGNEYLGLITIPLSTPSNR